VIAELKLRSTYPKGSSTDPCSRCGTPVDRRLPHVSYAYLELHCHETPEGTVGSVLGDEELAVLCQDCEEPDEPSADATAEFQLQEERTRA
jgi:hypothetical protein